MSLLGRSSERIASLAFVVMAAVVVAFYLADLAPRFLANAFEADRLFTYALLDDLFLRGGRLSSWNLGQHSDLFPDKMLSALAFLFARKIEIWYQVYTALMTALYFATAWYFFSIYERAMPSRAKANGLAFLLAFLAILIALVVWRRGQFVQFIVDLSYPSHHFAATLVAVLGAMIAIDALGTEGRRLAKRVAVAAILLFLVTLSDKIAVPIVLPSFAVAAVYYATVTGGVSSGLATACVGVFLSVIAAFLAGDSINNLFSQVTHLPLQIKLGTVGEQAKILLLEFFAPHSRSQFLVAIVLAASTLILLIVNAIRAILVASGQRPRMDAVDARRNTLVVYVASTAILHPLAIIAVGGLWEPLLVRETLTVFFCPLWLALAQLERTPLADASRGRISAIGIAIGVVFCIPVFNLQARPWRIDIKVPLLQCIRHYEETEGLRRGLGYHWDTTPVMLLSERRNVILTVISDAKIWHWVNNLDWYAPAPDNAPFTFIVLDRGIDHQAIEAKIGSPRKILQCADAGTDAGDKTIWLFDEPAAERLTKSITEQYDQLKARRR